MERTALSCHTLLNHYYKTSHCLYSMLGHLVLRALAHCGPFVWQSIKLFFSTSSKSLPLRFNLMLGYRGQIQLQSKEAQTQRTYGEKDPWAVPSSTGLQIWIFDYHTNSLDGFLFLNFSTLQCLSH